MAVNDRRSGGRNRVPGLFAATPSRIIRYGLINGLPGFVTMEGGNTLQTTALELVDGKIAGIYVVRNPDKLRHIDQTMH